MIFEDETESEFDIFLSDDEILNHSMYDEFRSQFTDLLTRKGFRDQFFHFYQDNSSLKLGYLLLDDCDIRLYCVVYSQNFIIVGSGGVKNTPNRQGTPKLELAFQRLKYVDTKFYERIRNREISYLPNNKLAGNLDFGGV